MRVAIPPCEGLVPNWHIDSKTMDLKTVASTGDVQLEHHQLVHHQLEHHQLVGGERHGQMLLCRAADAVGGSLHKHHVVKAF